MSDDEQKEEVLVSLGEACLCEVVMLRQIDGNFGGSEVNDGLM
jgi:hypothetical protein